MLQTISLLVIVFAAKFLSCNSIFWFPETKHQDNIPVSNRMIVLEFQDSNKIWTKINYGCIYFDRYILINTETCSDAFMNNKDKGSYRVSAMDQYNKVHQYSISNFYFESSNGLGYGLMQLSANIPVKKIPFLLEKFDYNKYINKVGNLHLFSDNRTATIMESNVCSIPHNNQQGLFCIRVSVISMEDNFLDDILPGAVFSIEDIVVGILPASKINKHADKASTYLKILPISGHTDFIQSTTQIHIEQTI